MSFDFAYAWRILPLILHGASVTVSLALAIYAVALVGGLVLAILRLALGDTPGRIIYEVSDFIRTTPSLVQLYAAFYILPLYGITLSAAATGIAVLGLQYATYTSEVYRAGIEAVPRGQWEAAVALGLHPRRTWMRIILPQAARKVVPPLGNYLVASFKSVPILAAITVQEMLGVSLTEAADTYRYYEPIALVGTMYLLMSLVAAGLVRFVEGRLAAA